MPTKCADPSGYVASLISLFDDAAFLEGLAERYVGAAGVAHGDGGGDGGGGGNDDAAIAASVCEGVQRAVRFLHEVVCAFVVHDLNGLLVRHTRKAAQGFVKMGTEAS